MTAAAVLAATAERDGIAALPALSQAELCALGAAGRSLVCERTWTWWTALGAGDRAALTVRSVELLAVRKLITAAGDPVRAAPAPGLAMILAARMAAGWITLIGCVIAMNLPHLSGFGIVAGVAAIWTLFMTLNLWGGVHAGIRVNDTGIQIGGIRARARRQRTGRWPPRKPFHVAGQGRAVFSCPWEGVRWLYLITDTRELKPFYGDLRQFMKRYNGSRRPLGVFRVLFMKSALVIISNPVLTSSDPATFRSNWGRTPAARSVQNHLPPGAVFAFKA